MNIPTHKQELLAQHILDALGKFDCAALHAWPGSADEVKCTILRVIMKDDKEEG